MNGLNGVSRILSSSVEKRGGGGVTPHQKPWYTWPLVRASCQGYGEVLNGIEGGDVVHRYGENGGRSNLTTEVKQWEPLPFGMKRDP